MKVEIKTPIPGPKSVALMQRRIAAVARGPFHVTPIFAKNAQGAWIEDVDGNRFLDFTAGIGVSNLGHAPAPAVSAMHRQAQAFVHTSFNVVPYEGYVQVCEKLNQHMPGDFAKKSFLANSGAEAVENAVKIARAYTKRDAIVCFEHAYHGRTYMAMGLTAKAKPYKWGFGPFPSEVYRVPFPDVYRWRGSNDPEVVSEECFALIVRQLTSEVGLENVAAIFIEPVLGEGGFIPAPISFLKKLRELCDQNGIVLVFDEVQTGFGRTGSVFASQQLGVAPDLLLTAKGLGAGLPLSAVSGKAAIMDAPIEGGIGGTFGGNPVACAAALSVFESMENGELLKNAKSLGDQLEQRLSAWKTRYSVIGDVRGLGPMRAIEFVSDRVTKTPDAEFTKRLVRECYGSGVIVMNAGTFGNVLRFLVPLCMTKSELDEGLGIIEACIEKLLSN